MPCGSTTALLNAIIANRELVRSGSSDITAENAEIIKNALIHGTLTVRGTKNFQISHPSKPKMDLVHSVLEGPEIAVFYRGTSTLQNGKLTITLPDYFEALTRLEDRTVLLTNIDGFDAIAVKSIDGTQVKDGKFTVSLTTHLQPKNSTGK